MLTSNNIVITGAGSGIGFETLKLLASGNNILAVDLDVQRIESLDLPNVVSLKCDVSSADGVRLVFDEAEKMFDKIDIFYANAGFPYYERIDYADWDRIDKIFKTNVYSPIFAYQLYLKHLHGRDGHFAITVSAIGKMAMPGYALYSASKFAMHGFQEAIRLELPKNVRLTCLYPVATDTGFFKKAVEGKDKPITQKPFPVQTPVHVAKCMVRGLKRGRKTVNPCKLFGFARVLFAVCPPIKHIYWMLEYKKLLNYEKA